MINNTTVSFVHFYKAFRKSGFKKTSFFEIDKKKALYFTPSHFNEDKGRYAEEYLALPYTPKYQLKFECSKPPPVGRVPKNKPEWFWMPESPKEREHFEGIRRVWPAFGKSGGGWEFMASNLNKQYSETAFSDGGFEENYGKIISPTVYDFIKIKIIYPFFKELSEKAKKDEKEPQHINLRSLDDEPSWAIYFRDVQKNEYTISMAFREQYGVRIWGVFWEDKISDYFSGGERFIWPVIMLTFPFKNWPEVEASRALEKIQEETMENKRLYNEILEILRNIKNALLKLNAYKEYLKSSDK